MELDFRDIEFQNATIGLKNVTMGLPQLGMGCSHLLKKYIYICRKTPL